MSATITRARALVQAAMQQLPVDSPAQQERCADEIVELLSPLILAVWRRLVARQRLTEQTLWRLMLMTLAGTFALLLRAGGREEVRQ